MAVIWHYLIPKQANLHAIQMLGGVEKAELEGGAFGIVDEADVGRALPWAMFTAPKLRPEPDWSG